MGTDNIPQSHVSFLERTIELLIVDGVSVECSAYYDFLKSYKLYNVTRVSTAQEASALIMSKKRFHVCLTDLEICDINGDEYYLLKQFSSRLPFIIMTDKDSLKLGFEIRKLGAFEAIKKPVNLQNIELIRLINDAVLQGIFKYIIAGNFKRVIIDAVNVFIETKPKNLRRWTEIIGIDERYFRRVWTECFGIPPRTVFMAYDVFLEAFVRYNIKYCKKFKLPESPVMFQLANGKSKNKHIQSVFKRHKKEMDSMLWGS
jgi:CheY-like chemotaxis protein